MAQGYVVLAASTPPNSSLVVAMFVVGNTQNDLDALSRANAFKAANNPTGTVQPMTVDNYNTSVVINP
jgi:hypothetical protein